MRDDPGLFEDCESARWKELVPPILMAFGAISLLRTSRLASLALAGMLLYDVAKEADGRNARNRRRRDDEIDTESKDSFPASYPPSYAGTTSGAPE